RSKALIFVAFFDKVLNNAVALSSRGMLSVVRKLPLCTNEKKISV
ncbi:24623_t:CDS:1, partial [Gigaspora rosea]